MKRMIAAPKRGCRFDAGDVSEYIAWI